MPNEIGLIQKYLDKEIDTVFVLESVTNDLLQEAGRIDLNFTNTATVRVYNAETSRLFDYARVNEGTTGDPYVHKQGTSGDGYHKGNVKGSWEVFTLAYDRGIQFQIDAATNEEAGGLPIATTFDQFLRTAVVPETDAIRFSRIAERCSASLGNKVTETPTASNILALFNQGFEWLKERGVPSQDQVIYVNPSIMTLIRNSDKLVKYLTQEDYKNGDNTFTLTKFEGRKIIEVTSDRFFTDVQVGDDGFYPSSNSKVINYLIAYKKSVIPVVKIYKSKIWSPDQVQDFDGYKVNFRIQHDCFVPKNKILGCYLSVSAVDAKTKTSTLSVETYPGKSTNGFIVRTYWTLPGGALGKLVYSQSAFTLNTQVTIDGTTIVETPVGEEIDASTNTTAYFALVNEWGIVVATTPTAVPLDKKSA